MKVAFDQNVPIGMVKVLRTIASESQFRRVSGGFDLKAAEDYTPKPGDSDYRPKDDVPWLKRFADDGGRVVISGDTNMRHKAHERLALIECGFVVIFFEPQWSSWKFWRKCALLIHWWPVIADKIKRVRKPSFYYVPCHWIEDGKLRWVSNKDPKQLKVERRQAEKRRKSKSKAKIAPRDDEVPLLKYAANKKEESDAQT